MLEAMALEACIRSNCEPSTAVSASEEVRREAEEWVEKTKADPHLLFGKDYNKISLRGASVFISLNLGFD